MTDTGMTDTGVHTQPRAIPGHRFVASAFWRALPAGMRRRWWMFRPLDLMARHWPIFKRRRGLLVVRMDGIGDMVLFRAGLDHYAEAFGVEKADVTVLGCASWGGIAEEVFAGYRVEIIDEHAYARQPLYRFRVSLWVRQLAPAIAVCDSYLRRALMADSLVWVSAAPRQVVSLPYVNEPVRPEFKYYLSQVDKIVDTGVYPVHEVVRHYRFVSALTGRDVAPAPPRIAWRDQKPPIVGGAPYVVLNPGSNEPGRRWPFSGYREMADRLLAAGYRVVLVGSAEEKPEDDAVADLSGHAGVIDLIGRTALPGLLDLMKHAAAVISNDTGPAHVSIALGTPTMVVVGGGHFGCFVPYPEGVAPAHARFVFHEMECYHCFWRCHKRARKEDVFPCIDAVSVDQVWAEVKALLDQGADDAMAQTES
ncbi:MAG: glycosyltransferase family 9 protein [Rhodospirillales bacterium]|nr:glycosyltransferase family 9 protein [Rhodospirillales bacterium]